ncbi:MAG: L-methionine (R)-S-oxide reductase, partial [Planctomycetota bacterium]
FTTEGPAAALGMVMQHFEADGGTIHLLGEDGNLHLKANLPEMPPDLLKIISIIPVGKGMAGLAVQRGVPVQSCNIQTDDTGDVKPGAKKTGLQGSTCVPILRGERAVGALGVGTVAEHTYTDEENELLMEMGRQLCD